MYKLLLFQVVEGLRITTDKLDSKNFYAFNPSFDKCDQKKRCDKKYTDKMHMDKMPDCDKMHMDKMPDCDCDKK